MVAPGLRARVEEFHRPARCGVFSAEIIAAGQVAMRARQGKILRLVSAAVLAGNDVIDMKLHDERPFLAVPTVLTAIAGTLAYESAGGGIH